MVLRQYFGSQARECVKVEPAAAAQKNVHPQFFNLTILTCRMWTTDVLSGHLPANPHSKQW